VHVNTYDVNGDDMDDSGAVLTVEETARRLRISRAKAYQLSQRGLIPTLKLGRRRVVPLRQLEAWIESQTKAAS
jgi:excisionase family DNA binding protein